MAERKQQERERLTEIVAYRFGRSELDVVELAAKLDGRRLRTWLREVAVAAARRRIAKGDR